MSQSSDANATLPLPTGIGLTALDPLFREDPYPILARLRAEAPVHYDAELKRYVFTRHDDVHAILRNTDYWSDPRRANPGTFSERFLSQGDGEPSMLLMDDPGHKRLRDLVRRSFTPRAVEQWRTRVRSIAERVVAGLPDGPFDALREFAGPLPTIVIAEMLGVDPARSADFKEWSDISTQVGFNPAPEPHQLAAAEIARGELDALFFAEIAKRKKLPPDSMSPDLISGMVGEELAGDQLTEREIVTQCNLLLVAGNVTTTDLLSNALKALADHPDQLDQLAADLDLLRNAVEETLRYDTPVTNSGRIAHRDIEIGGIAIAKGESLSVSLAAANRDPAIYPDPDRFDLAREDRHTAAFGGGRHFCLGAHLSKLEAEEGLRAFITRFPRFGIGSNGFRYAAVPSFRGFEELWIAPIR
jgi:cytochrome P450